MYNLDSELKQNSIYFSYIQRFNARKKFIKNIFEQNSEQESIALYSDCHVSAISLSDQKNEVRVVVRRIDYKYSTFRKRCVKIRFMMGFDIKEIPEPFDETTNEKLMLTPCLGNKDAPRWILKLTNYKDKKHTNYFLWEYAQDGMNIEQSKIYEIWHTIKQKMNSPDPSKMDTFDLPIKDEHVGIVPVIYQPAIDVWDNFLRAVYCYPIKKSENECIYEITLVFNDERLRKHGFLDKIYRIVRFLLYRRIMDVESFKIIVKNKDTSFDFTGIYSDDSVLKDDNVHLSCQGDGKKKKKRWDLNQYFSKKRCPINVKYFFSNKEHPIVFINTSNHAMAEHDTNHNLWKWEYRPWEDDTSVLFGRVPNSDIKKYFRRNGWTLEPAEQLPIKCKSMVAKTNNA